MCGEWDGGRLHRVAPPGHQRSASQHHQNPLLEELPRGSLRIASYGFSLDARRTSWPFGRQSSGFRRASWCRVAAPSCTRGWPRETQRTCLLRGIRQTSTQCPTARRLTWRSLGRPRRIQGTLTKKMSGEGQAGLSGTKVSFGAQSNFA